MLFGDCQEITLDDKGSELLYMPSWCDESDSQHFFDQLLSETNWQQDHIHIYGKKQTLPRKTAWYGDKGVSYAYSGIQMKAVGWTSLLMQLKERIEQTSGHRFNSVLLNYYENGQAGMGWHSDDEPELGGSPTIASLSLGEVRRFDLRKKQSSVSKANGVKAETKQLLLESGSLLIMKGAMQRYWQHSVAKSRNVEQARINLTFRFIES